MSKTYMVPMFALVEAASEKEAIEIAYAELAGTGGVCLLVDEALDPVAYEDMEVHSILDLYTDEEIADARNA